LLDGLPAGDGVRDPPAADRLGRFEEQLRWCRLGWNGRSESQSGKYDTERERLEARLRELLDDETVKP